MTNQDLGSRESQTPWTDAVERTPGGLKGAARSFAKALGTIRPAEVEPKYKPAVPFGELHIFQSMNKHRSVANMFGLKNPFYRAHDGRLGAIAVHEGRELVNFASYDYLGLNQEPAVAEAAKAAIDEMGTSVSASRLVAGERMHAPRAREGAGRLLRLGCLPRLRQRSRHQHFDDRPADGARGPHRAGRADAQQRDRGGQAVARDRHQFPPQQPRPPRAGAAGEPREAQERADRRRGPLFDGRRLSRPAPPDRDQEALWLLADDRRGAFPRRHGQDGARLVRALRRRPARGRHLDGHAQQDAGQLRRLHLRQPAI